MSLRLRSLEIQGFKSFPDKTVLKFDQDITAVVGPNGSGKSNIADAMRWVLGEQSSKTLRGNRMEDVIFSGTQSRKAVGFAMVQITIDNTDRTLEMDEDAITISRRLYRSGESEYRLCGTAVRLRDIHEMLMDTGLGRDGYSIIGQGRIAEIVSAKGTHRREIFEEAAGIAKYRYRKEEAEKQLEKAEENLLRLRDILVELEDRVGPLKIQAEKAKKYLELSSERKELEISLWALSLDRLKGQLASQQDKLDLCKNQYAQMETHSEQLEEEINDIYATAQRIGVEIEEKRAKIREIEEQSAEGQSRAAVLQNDIHHNQLSVQRLEQELASAGMDTDELLAQVAVKEQELEEGAASITQLDTKLAATEQRLADQREQTSRVEKEMLSLTVQQSTLVEAIQEAKLSKQRSATLLAEGSQRAEALKQSSGAGLSAVEELEQSLEECITRIKQQEEEKESLLNMQRGYGLKRESRVAKLKELQDKAAGIEQAVNEKKQRARLLEDLESNMEGYAGSVKYIMREVSKGAISGVFGAVSSLIDTDPDYTVAIETALGAAMQNVVVADENTAKRAISMLKNARAGRATFLPLTSIKSRGTLEKSALSRQEGFVGAASDLVRYDSKFSEIVLQLLGKVAVVEDIDVGTNIARSYGYRFRVVTLDGQVINAGGSFTGGSTVRSAGVLGRRHEIEKLQNQAQGLELQLKELSPELKSASEQLAMLDATIQGVQAEMQTAQEEIVRLGFSKDSIARNLEQANESCKNAKLELEKLYARLSEIEGSDKSSTELMEQLELKQAELEEQIKSTNERKNTLTVGTTTVGELLAEHRMIKLSAEKDQELLTQEVQRMREQAENVGTRSQQLEEQKQQLLEANKSIEQQILQLGGQKEQLGKQVESMQAEIATLMEQRTGQEKKTTELRAREREISTEREGVSRELARLEERRGTIQSEYDGIISKLWDEYELTRRTAEEMAKPLDDPDKANRRLIELRGKIRAIGTVNVEAVEEYAQVSERYEFLSKQVGDVEQSKAQLLKLINELTGQMREQFMESFTAIAEHFSKIFVQLFGGGRAELTLSEEEDVLESGVDIFVQPPGKIIKSLSLLSGGEQSFVAIAIYFAILKVRPAPFCLLDEIEAALDDVNVSRFAEYLRRMSDNTQFIAITHRRGTMEEADVLYGVTMQDEGVSKLLELNVTEVESKLGL